MENKDKNSSETNKPTNKNFCPYDKVKLTKNGVNIAIIVCAIILIVLLLVGVFVFRS